MVDFEKRPISIRAQGAANLGPLGPGTILGLLLVLLGTLLFIDNLDLLPFSVARAFWPLAILTASAIALRRASATVIRVAAITGLVWGGLLLLNTLNLIRVRGVLLGPLILIAIGVILLLYRVRLKDIPWEEWKCANLRIGSNARTRTTGNRADEYAVFSGVRRNVENLNFEGGEMTAVFGSIEVDLRRASISSPEKQATIEANVAFGAIELRIPESWRVALRGNAVFGAYEDKTIPPRPDAGSVVPTLVVRGGTAFGAVTVRN